MLNRALQFIQTGENAKAWDLLRQVLAREPGNPDALHLAGVVHFRTGDVRGGAEYLARAAALRPERIDYQCNLGLALVAAGRRDEATAAFLRAAALPCNGAGLLTHLADELRRSGRYIEALDCSRRALGFKPDDPQVLTVHGRNLMATGEYTAATQLIRRALVGRPDDADAHWDLGMLLLAQGELAEGYREVEWRFRSPGSQLVRGFSQPQWDGDSLAGKTLLIHAEGGFGDSIHSVRYVPLLKGRVQRVILECPAALVSLFESLEGVDEMIVGGEKLPPFDAHVPLPSLPCAFKTDLNSIPNRVPYLTVPSDRLTRWSERVGSDGGLKVGLVWGGHRTDPTDKRSIGLERLSSLGSIPGVRLFSLQMGEDAGQARPAGMEIVDYTAEIGDFADTAALVMQLDLVISIDTSVAHLAGALGKPVWLLALFVAAYQWMLNRSDSPWYPTMRIFRQPDFDDWGTPIAQVVTALKEWK